MRRMRRLDAIRDAAALSLLPVNVDYFGALECLGVLAGQNASGLIRPDGPSWRAWLSGREARSLLVASPGIIDRPAVQTTIIDGRKYVVLLGRSGSEAIASRLLSESLIAMPEEDPHCETALAILKAGFGLGEAVLLDSGLPQSPWPSHGEGRITVPNRQRLERLRAAVTVSERRLAQIGDLSLLAPLFGASEDLEDRGRRPLVRLDRGVLVAAPFSLSSAVLSYAWEQIRMSACADQITARMREQWLAETVALCELCDWSVERTGDDGVLLVELDEGTTAEIQLLLAQPGADGQSWLADAPVSQPVQEGTERLFTISALLACGGQAGLRIDSAQGTNWWVLDAQGFEYLLDATRLDPLALVRCHRGLPQSMSNAAPTDLLDIVGTVRFIEDNGFSLDPQTDDPTELTVTVARLNAARHCEPGWERPDRAVQVIRYRHSNDARVFVPLVPGPQLRLLVADGSSVCWVSTKGTPASRWSAEAVLARMTVFWAARLMAAGLLKEDDQRGWSSITVDYDHEDLKIVATSGVIGPSGGSLSFGAGFLLELAREDNSADRRLIGALLDLIFGFATGEEIRLRKEFLDALAPLGAGTFAIWKDPSISDTPAGAPGVPATSGRECLRAKADIAEALRAAGAIGVADGVRAKEWLDAAVASGIQLLDREVAACGPELLDRLVALYELVALEAQANTIEHPLRAALGEIDHDAFLEDAQEVGIRNGAIRFLVEMAHARSPQGVRRANIERIDRLRALAELILYFAAMSDAAYGGLIELKVIVAADGPAIIAMSDEVTNAREAQWLSRWLSITETEPDSWRESLPEWAREISAPGSTLDEPLKLSGAWEETSQAMRRALGFSFDELVRVMQAVAGRSRGARGPVRLQMDDLVLDAARVTSIDAKACRAAIDFVSSEPATDYDPLLSRFKPWKSGRDTGYLRRPLLILGDTVLFGPMHVLVSLTIVIRRLQAERLHFEDPELRAAAAKLRKSIGGQWEDELGRRVESLELLVRVRCECPGGRPMKNEQGNLIGDVDVLAVDPSRRIVWALDAKSIASDVTPLRLRTEARKLRKEIPKHQRRIEWLERNRDAIAAEFGLDPQHLLKWEIRGALVLDEPLGGTFTFVPALPILTWPELRIEMNGPPRA